MKKIDDMILRVSTWDFVNDFGVQSALITDGDDIEVGDTLIDERAGWRLARDDVQEPGDDFLLFRGIECSKICSGFFSKDDPRLFVR